MNEAGSARAKPKITAKLSEKIGIPIIRMAITNNREAGKVATEAAKAEVVVVVGEAVVGAGEAEVHNKTSTLISPKMGTITIMLRVRVDNQPPLLNGLHKAR